MKKKKVNHAVASACSDATINANYTFDEYGPGLIFVRDKANSVHGGGYRINIDKALWQPKGDIMRSLITDNDRVFIFAAPTELYLDGPTPERSLSVIAELFKPLNKKTRLYKKVRSYKCVCVPKQIRTKTKS